jgi:hypothetical protein
LKHKPYYDVTMPPEATAIIRENVEWSTPVALVPKIQALHPHVSTNQVYSGWAVMSEELWKRDKLQLPSARALLAEFQKDVDVFDITATEGVEQLCWGMTKIGLWRSVWMPLVSAI